MWGEDRQLVFHMSRGHKAATRAALAGFSAVVLLLAVVVYVPQLQGHDKHTWHSSITLVSKRAYPVYLPTGPP
jgi:hypothetical protein